MLDQALKTIDDLKGRVQALEADKQKAAVAAPAAAASGPAAVGRAGGVGRHARRRRDDARCRQGAHRGLRAGDARQHLRLQAHEPGLERDAAAVADSGQLPGRWTQRSGCGKDGDWIFSARQSSLGLRSFIPTSFGPDQDRPELRPVRQRRQHLDPLAQHLGRTGHVRRRPDLLELHGHRRVPQHHRLLGPERHGLRAQPAVAHHAVEPGRHGPRASRWKRRTRRWTPARSARSRPTSAPASPAGTVCPT